jgi:long-chain fatty acid transport protein
MKRLIIHLIVFMLIALHTAANPYQFPGVKTNGMGGILNILAPDAEAVWANPAAMSAIPARMNISAGINTIFDYTGFQMQEPSLYTGFTNNPIRLPLFFYGSYQVNQKFNVGISYNSAFSQRIRWQEENWAGRFIVKEMDLASIVLQPAVSYRLTDKTTLGAGIMMLSSQLKFSRVLPFRDINSEGLMLISGRSVSWGFSMGIHSEISEMMTIGLDFRSAPRIHFTGARTDFSTPASVSEYFPENTTHVDLTIPATIEFMAARRVTKKLHLISKMGYIFRSDHSMSFDFEHNSRFLNDFEFEQSQRDQVYMAAAIEYTHADYVKIRGGSWFHGLLSGKEFVSPHYPWASRIAFTAGASLIPATGLSVDFSFMYLTGIGQETGYTPAGFSGTYRYNSFIPGIGLSYTL